jgi:hypothetical protein
MPGQSVRRAADLAGSWSILYLGGKPVVSPDADLLVFPTEFDVQVGSIVFGLWAKVDI